jgi:CheY-like chemotaxis protein
MEKLPRNYFVIKILTLMDGYEATKYIREQFPPEKSNIPILAMTAHAHIAKDEKFKEYGMDDFVLKPFEPEDLFYKIAKYIKRS